MNHPLCFVNNSYLCDGLWCSCRFHRWLVKGNPVRIRSYTRSCMFLGVSNSPLPLPLSGGKAFERNEPENLPCPLCFIQTPGKGFIDYSYVA